MSGWLWIFLGLAALWGAWRSVDRMRAEYDPDADSVCSNDYIGKSSKTVSAASAGAAEEDQFCVPEGAYPEASIRRLVNIDGTPMINDAIDTEGKPYGITRWLSSGFGSSFTHDDSSWSRGSSGSGWSSDSWSGSGSSLDKDW